MDRCLFERYIVKQGGVYLDSLLDSLYFFEFSLFQECCNICKSNRAQSEISQPFIALNSSCRALSVKTEARCRQI